ncbi:MAG: hypothetical protein AB1742_14600 [bacterium]
MKKTFSSGINLAGAVALCAAISVAGCGGGGGGGGAAGGGGGTPDRIVTVQVDFQNGASRAASAEGRAADRSASAAVADTPVIVYWAKDASRKLLNSASDRTDPSGRCNLTVNLGNKASLDVIVEALVAAAGSDSNVRLALDDLSTNLTGLAANDVTTTSADIFVLSSDTLSLAQLHEVVVLMNANSVNLDSIDTAQDASDLVAEVYPAIQNCGGIQDGPTRANCYETQIDSGDAALSADVQSALADLEVEFRVDTGGATTAETLYAIDKNQDLSVIQKIVDMAALASYTDFTRIDVAPELSELIAATANAVAKYDDAALTGGSRLIAIKRALLHALASTDFANNDVELLISDLRSAYYNAAIASAAADLSALVGTNDLISVISAYDVIEWMFIEVLTDQNMTLAEAVQTFDALVEVLKNFGASTGGGSAQIMNDLVAMWALASFQAELAKLLEPFDMYDRAKTDNLMVLARDLSALSSTHTRAQVEDVLNDYLSAATTQKALELYDRYYGKTDCAFDPATRTQTGTNCPTQAEIMALLETHYEKPLPLLDSTITGIAQWIQSGENDTLMIALGTGGSRIQQMIELMKQSDANAASISAALDAAGVASELAVLYINLEPYLQ